MLHSIRFRFVAFITSLLLLLLLLLNTYPLISSRDAVFEEKRRSLSNQAAVLASSLAGTERLNGDSVAEVLRFLDLSGLSRILVADAQGTVLYESAPGNDAWAREAVSQALAGQTVFRSVFADSAFASSLAMPLSSQGLITGAVYLYELDGERAQIILSFQSRIRTLSLVIGVAALLLAITYVLFLMQRIRGLARSMRVVAGGDYAYRHTVRGKDELSELGEEFNRLTERLETTEEQRRRFVSDASHELKTPLASIRLLADSISQSEEMDRETVREFAGDIGNEARRLQRTTEKLLDLSRLDDGVQVIAEPVDLKQTALDALVMLRPLARDRQVQLHLELEEGCVVMATGEDMFHVLFNLIENAIKYNIPEGCVTISLQKSDREVVLTVEDTGIGIPEEDRLNVFSRFYRVDKARSREAGGSGLGLSIVHDAVLAHGGSIAIGANKPQGTRFIVRFPRPTEEETGI